MERYSHELPLPPLVDVLAELEAGHLEYFEGSANRDGKRYRNVRLSGPKGWTVTGLHRIVAASTLGRWVDRKVQVDHINHDPSDNRAQNLQLLTPSQNQIRRRQPLDISKAVDPSKVKRKRPSRNRPKKQSQEVKTKTAISEYLALRNQHTWQAQSGPPATAQPPAKSPSVSGPLLARKDRRTPPDEQAMQEARNTFAAKHAYRNK